jgi:hypothetical protein
MQPFEAYPSRSKLRNLLLLNGVMIAGAVLCITLPDLETQLAGWAGIAFFSLSFIVTARSWFRTSQPKIVIDDAGIHTGSSIGTIDWPDVTGLRIDSIKRIKLLSIYVLDKQKYLNRMPMLARAAAKLHPYLGCSELTINFVGLTPGIDDACRYLQKRGWTFPGFE